MSSPGAVVVGPRTHDAPDAPRASILATRFCARARADVVPDAHRVARSLTSSVHAPAPTLTGRQPVLVPVRRRPPAACVPEPRHDRPPPRRQRRWGTVTIIIVIVIAIIVIIIFFIITITVFIIALIIINVIIVLLIIINVIKFVILHVFF